MLGQKSIKNEIYRSRIYTETKFIKSYVYVL